MPEVVATDHRSLFASLRALRAFATILVLAGGAAALAQGGQTNTGVGIQSAPIQIPQPPIDSSTYQGSLTQQKATPGVLQLSLDDAIQRGLRYNLGLILTS
ncbi:MAG TPA: hypothetical protein VJS11_08490, partial [Acidobacteriaceae bacterium]|nr:hypothetical protein [Acidobacteriaceae bacterium]